MHDPLADPAEARAVYGIDLAADLDSLSGYAAVIGAVPHSAYKALQPADFKRLVAPGGLVADLKGMWRDLEISEGLRRWTF